jgi:small subunit ribosomal protein S20
MPHTKSAKKRLRQNTKRRLNNRAIKKAVKTQIKKVLATAEAGNLDQLKQEYNLAAKKLDRAAAKHVVHPNLAARKKSQLAVLINEKEAAGKAAPPTA